MRTLKPHRKIRGTLTLPGDKSISQRAALISLLVKEPLQIKNYSDGEDGQSALSAIQTLGVEIKSGGSPSEFTLIPPEIVTASQTLVDCGNSGTTARLLAGLLSGLDIAVELEGDESLKSRPMSRVIDPLTELGAAFESVENKLPLKILGGAHGSIDYTLPVPSAQVKSALLLAVSAGGGTAIITEPVAVRDHTERMLEHLGAKISKNSPRVELQDDPNDPRKKLRVVLDSWQSQVVLKGNGKLSAAEIDIPGDISTAAFFLAAAAIGKGELTIENLGLNPTRTAFLDYLRSVGCDVIVSDRSVISGEPRGTVTVSGAKLKPRKISNPLATRLIDEIPIVAVMSCFAEGPTVIRDVGELRVKESDRIESLIYNLRAMGAEVGAIEDDGIVIESKIELQPADFKSFGDHRIAMAFSIAALFLPGDSTLDRDECVAISCPRFYDYLKQITTK